MSWLKETLRPFANRVINRKRKCFEAVKSRISNAVGLEIGGPSAIFASDGPLPIYRYAKRIDGVNYAAATFWSEFGDSGYRPAENLETGRQMVVDSGDLRQLPTAEYDFIAASHVVEHLANPIKTLIEWVRAVRVGGVVILVVPCKKRTYDKDRPTTELGHIIEDFVGNVGEDDRTHFAEVIHRHNFFLDSTIQNRGELLQRTLDNHANRILHHHVFDEKLITAMGELVGLKSMGSTTIYPYHIVATFIKQR